MPTYASAFHPLILSTWNFYGMQPYEFPKDVPADFWQPLLLSYPPFTEDGQLQKFLRSDRAAQEKQRVFLYLQPMESDGKWLPILRLTCDLEGSRPRVWLRVGLFHLDPGSQLAIGFRFESPEGEGEGKHSYYHAQLITGFERDRQFYAYHTDSDMFPLTKLPTKFPALPLDAKDPVMLVLCLLLSLYGRKCLGRLRTSNSARTFEHHIDKLTCLA